MLRIPPTNDQLKYQFRKIYGREPASYFEFEQFRKNRPVKFFEPRKMKKRKAKTPRNSVVNIPSPELVADVANDLSNAAVFVLELTDGDNEEPAENTQNVQGPERDDEKEEESKQTRGQGMIANG
jgi:hypothetical protein